jgi:hypothetical protein
MRPPKDAAQIPYRGRSSNYEIVAKRHEQWAGECLCHHCEGAAQAVPGIGQATLYKYFPDIEAILHAWRQRHVARSPRPHHRAT